jgi:hypothetical protein
MSEEARRTVAPTKDYDVYMASQHRGLGNFWCDSSNNWTWTILSDPVGSHHRKKNLAIRKM